MQHPNLNIGLFDAGSRTRTHVLGEQGRGGSPSLPSHRSLPAPRSCLDMIPFIFSLFQSALGLVESHSTPDRAESPAVLLVLEGFFLGYTCSGAK